MIQICKFYQLKILFNGLKVVYYDLLIEGQAFNKLFSDKTTLTIATFRTEFTFIVGHSLLGIKRRNFGKAFGANESVAYICLAIPRIFEII